MKKVLVTLLILGILGAGGYGVYHHFFENKETSAERVSSDSEDAVYVDLVSQITGSGSDNGLFNRYGGEVEPQDTLEVKLENERTVEECFVEEGDEVKEGQKLFVYDTQEDEDKLAQAEIDIEKAEGDIEVSEKAIEQYEKEKAKASQEDQLTITTSILQEQNDIKRNEYEIKSNELEIEKLKESIANATVTAEMAGIVQKISEPGSSDSYSSYGNNSENVYITILAVGDYRIKGTVNEQNYNQLEAGMPMIVHSRVDDTLTWKGTVSEIKTEKDNDSNEDMYYGYDDGAGSSNYTFYVELENSDGLMLGQHVYMEEDAGQEDQKEGLWLEEYYIMEEDDHAYVWLANKSNLIEKHEVTLGEYDEELFQYEILDGLTLDDYIAYPMDTISEGNPVIYNDYSASVPMGMPSEEGSFDGGFDNMDFDDGSLAEGIYDGGFDDEDFGDDEDFDDEDFDDEDFDGEDFDDEEFAHEAE